MIFFLPFLMLEAFIEGLQHALIDAYWQAEYDAISRSMGT